MNASGDLTAQLEGTPLPLLRLLTTNGFNAREYHTHQVEYDPTNSQATYRLDGIVVSTWTGQSISLDNGQVFWGAAVPAGMGQMDFRSVQFEILSAGLVAAYDAGTATNPVPSPLTRGWTTNGGAAAVGPVSPDRETAFSVSPG